ncbi:DNA directed, epsilon, isoform CRA_a [Jimgerdemannia flammicorona]|uniref:DNA polymerase epsilon catalytic subunit n=1 Tax=Jimgerdemannia flammicorona TaxID=994334 RepID=A0A433QW19_9FUNG|nr:DNA directed, epsilon, isoform CRA_a [Jimgerdemannia flammicorona]
MITVVRISFKNESMYERQSFGSRISTHLQLQVEAYKANVIMPNKHADEIGKMFEGHLLESETYVGGHVEALEAGVFRSDIPTKFKIEPEAVQQLINEVDQAMKFFIEVEEKKVLSEIINYDEICNEIVTKLQDLRDTPLRQERPRIYHLDVAAMYPNIILTNRLQPDALIDESMCAGCDFNRPGKTCDRRMSWLWRGEYFPAKRNELNMIKNQLMIENFPPRRPNEPRRQWSSLSEAEQSSLVEKRLGEYCRKVYKKVHETQTVERTSIICQRENPFYIETVRAFRDRRYEYKGLHKTWKKNLDEALQGGSLAAVDEAKKMIVLYDSLQLAHKCILNSFYGYVMRKGARWYSMEMAGITCYTGSTIIQMARQLVEKIGRPLELDTDGIWCILPANFPENFSLKLANGKAITLSYPCTMLNHRVHARFTNHQYQELVDPETYKYSTRSENSIFFEVDGPYRAMILPSSKEEDKLLKKRYAVFNEDGSLAELKGFEVKRRGELKLIKIFQSQIFKVFLEGSTLEECYAAVAKVANQWLDVLYSKGTNLEDEELVELISENRSMSKTLEDYGAQKSTSISTAKRLAEFLGDQMVKDKGLACKFIISAKPIGAPVTERAIPVVIFTAESSVRKHFLRKWLKDNGITSFDIRDILDWPYYLERLGSVIQKLITIPAALQKVPNPVPRIRHPDWLFKRVASKDDKFKQHRITDMFSIAPNKASMIGGDDIEIDQDIDMQDVERQLIGAQSKSVIAIGDMEDLGIEKSRNLLRDGKLVPTVHKSSRRRMDESKSPSLISGLLVEALLDEDKSENMPNMYNDYQSWLQFQKRKWKRQRNDRERRRSLYGAVHQTSATLTSNTVGNFFRQQAGSLVTSPWQIVQIAETETAGELRMWVLIQKNMYTIRLSVPRVFYVNTREEEPTEGLRHNPNCRVQRRIRTLPRSHQCLHLFEMTMPEAVFQAEQKKFSSFFNHSSTEGVYETQIPLLTRALLKLGCVCIVDRQTKLDFSGKHLEDRFSLEDLKNQGNVFFPYLEDKGILNYLYLYHTTSDSRHFFALVPTALQKAYIFIVGASKESDQMPNLTKIYTERLVEHNKDASKSSPNTAFEYNKSMDFEVGYFQNEIQALRAIQGTVSQYKDARKGPTVLIVHSPRPFHALVQNASILVEFPNISIPSHKSDNRFNALDWIRPVARRMIIQFLDVGNWITGKLQLARYANVPFCNIQNDSYLHLADIFFARRLMKHDMVLWWSASAKPDLGGREEDENLFLIEELANPEMSVPGSYNTVCIELDVIRLCVNTLMQSSLINDFEGTGGGIGFDNVAHTLEEYNSGKAGSSVSFGDGTISAKTFAMLKTMVQGWLGEVLDADNRYAEMMIETLHRWLTSPNSNMYDPCLYGLVHGMMKKVFMQLVAEIKRLGSRIIYASFNKIIIATSKESIESASAYGSYLLKVIMAKPLFQILDLVSVHYWEQLLWMDSKNYGGMKCQHQRNGDDALNELPNETELDMQWNIQDYLPPTPQKHFRDTVADFISKVYKHRTPQIGQARGRTNKMNESQPGAADDVVTFTKQLVSQHITRIVLDIVPEIQRVVGDAEISFPILAGSHLPLTNPALEFVKFVCATLSLDLDLSHEVRILRRNCLDLIGIREFAPEAQFRNPCEFFTLPQVICGYCNFSADLDFCRDRDLMPHNGRLQIWRCKGCTMDYDKLFIEETLVAEVERRAMAYQLQDLKCRKCAQIKVVNLANQCKCSGEFVTTQTKTEFVKKMRIFMNVAKEQQLILRLTI